MVGSDEVSVASDGWPLFSAMLTVVYEPARTRKAAPATPTQSGPVLKEGKKSQWAKGEKRGLARRTFLFPRGIAIGR